MAKISDAEWATLCFCRLTERQWEVCFDILSKHLGVPYPPHVMINQMRGEIRLDSITDSPYCARTKTILTERLF